MNNSYITIIKEKRTALSRKRIPLNQNGCTANFRIGVPFEQNLHAKSETSLPTLFAGGIRDMPKPKTSTGEKNLISQRLIELRRQHNMSQRLLAYQLQLNGYDMDKNVITRIETNKRYVTDVELKALTEIFHVSYEYLIEGKEKS